MKKFLTCILTFLCTFNNLFAQKDYYAEIQFLISSDSIIQNKEWFDYLEVVETLNDSEIESVIVVSSTSPDGSKEFNKYLADKRAQKVVSTLSNISKNKIVTKSISENYDNLYEAVYNSDEPFRDELLYILSNGQEVKKEIQARRYIWRKLVDNYFQPLRSARIYIKYKEKPCNCDTVYIHTIDTLIFRDTVYVDKQFTKVPMIAIKTNVITDALAAPNIQLEWYTHLKGTSVELDYTCPWWHNDDIYFYYQIINGIVGIRKYLNETYDGHWVGVYGNGFLYDICISEDDGWQGEGYGFGLSYGYAWRSKKYAKLRFELYGRVGYLKTMYDTYYAGAPFNGKYYYYWFGRINDFVPRNLHKEYFGPTMVGFNISYDLIYRKKH